MNLPKQVIQLLAFSCVAFDICPLPWRGDSRCMRVAPVRKADFGPQSTEVSILTTHFFIADNHFIPFVSHSNTYGIWYSNKDLFFFK